MNGGSELPTNSEFTVSLVLMSGLHLGGGAQGGIRPPFVASCPPKFFSGFTCSTVHTFKRATLSSTFCPPHHPFSKCNPACAQDSRTRFYHSISNILAYIHVLRIHLFIRPCMLHCLYNTWICSPPLSCLGGLVVRALVM